MPHFIIEIQGVDKKPYTVILGSEAVIGREKTNTIWIDDTHASRQHAKVIREPDGSYTMVDLGSRNGIIVNGARMSRRKLAEKDRIIIGRTVLVYSESAPNQTAENVLMPAEAETVRLNKTDKPCSVEAEPTKLRSDSIKEAIQNLDSASSDNDKSAGHTGARQTSPAGSTGSRVTAVRTAATQGRAVDNGPSFWSRVLVFLGLLLFFVAILLWSKWAGEKLMARLEKSHQAKNLTAPKDTANNPK